MNARTRNSTFTPLLALVTIACTTSCSVGSGDYRVSIYGEAFIEEGIPSDVFVDGWSVEFYAFVVAVDGVTVHGASTGSLGEVFLVDLTEPSQGDGHEVGQITDLEAGDYQALDYRVGPVENPAVLFADEAIVGTMLENGYSVFVYGFATRENETITFVWPFSNDTLYDACETGGTLEDGGELHSQLTIHSDHLFYDDLDSEEPNVAFDLIASADDGDGNVTLEELEMVDITGEERYQVGSRPIYDLRAFIEAQVETLGHIDGEGHCR